MVLQMCAKCGYLKDFLIFIDYFHCLWICDKNEIFWGNKSKFWEPYFENLMVFYSVFDLSV